MDQYVALDVSLQKTAVCVLNVSGRVLIEADVPSEPAALIAFIQTHAPRAARVGLESGPTSPWLWHSLRAAGLPVVCVDARHAHAALSVRPSKSDRNDARGLAEMMRIGWYREVQVKSLAAHERMALLGVRRRLVDMRVEIDGQIRGILKTFGLVVGRGNKGAFAQRARMLAQDIRSCRRSISSAGGAVPKWLWTRIRVLSATTCATFMMPGVGPVTALGFSLHSDRTGSRGLGISPFSNLRGPIYSEAASPHYSAALVAQAWEEGISFQHADSKCRLDLLPVRRPFAI